MMSDVLRVLMLSLLWLNLLPPAQVQPQEPETRVALVVDFGNGEVVNQCLNFTEPSVTGLDVLNASGLEAVTDLQAGGAAVCGIAGVGCPATDCFCECRGGADCTYWSYWRLGDNSWEYSSAGANRAAVTDGMVEGWVWGMGTVVQAQQPPVLAFADICGGEVRPAAVAADATSVAAATEADSERQSLEAYLPYIVLPAVLVGLALLGRNRRRT